MDACIVSSSAHLEGSGHLLHRRQKLGLGGVALVHLREASKGAREKGGAPVSRQAISQRAALCRPSPREAACLAALRPLVALRCARATDLGEDGAQAGQRDACAGWWWLRVADKEVGRS